MDADRIIRPMGAASLLIERDECRPGRLFVSLEGGRDSRCLYMASVGADVAATLGFEAAGEYFDHGAEAAAWLASREQALSYAALTPVHLVDWRDPAPA